MTVELDVEEYKKGVEELRFSAMGRLFIPRNDPIPTTMEIKAKLVEGFHIEDLKIIAMGRGLFHLILNNLEDQCKILSAGSLFMKPGIFCFNRWMLGFATVKQMQTNTQVWIRLYNIPLEYQKHQNLLNIAMGVGLPIEIDPLTISLMECL